jgi:hypothetical protein
MHQLNSTKRARVTSNAIHLPGSRILHFVRFRYPIQILDPARTDFFRSRSITIIEDAKLEAGHLVLSNPLTFWCDFSRKPVG